MATANLVLSTAGSEEEAERLAQALVGDQLAACVNIVGPIRSVYRWHGEVDTASEFLLLVKTTEEQVEAVIATIRRLHSYEVPEAIVVDIEQGSVDYLRWITQSVR